MTSLNAHAEPSRKRESGSVLGERFGLDATYAEIGEGKPYQGSGCFDRIAAAPVFSPQLTPECSLILVIPNDPDTAGSDQTEARLLNSQLEAQARYLSRPAQELTEQLG
jgi:hypothetical protein